MCFYNCYSFTCLSDITCHCHFQIEFGSVYANGRESDFCTEHHDKWVTIDRDCIYAGCRQPPPFPNLYSLVSSETWRPPKVYPLRGPGVATDLYDIQKEIFKTMGPN